MSRLGLLILLAAVMLIVACAPMVTVENQTRFPVRAIVFSNGERNVLSPSPGESSAAEVSQGAYTVAVIPDAEWIGYAKAKRQYLNERLANADALTGPQLLDVVNQLKDIALRMQQYEQAGSTSGASCTGRIGGEDGGGLVQVTTTAAGQLAVVCK